MSLTNQGTKMQKTVVAQAIDQVIDQADQAGELFAKSEIDANQALELFARAVGTEPSFEVWTANACIVCQRLCSHQADRQG
jgi:hypothetical protein